MKKLSIASVLLISCFLAHAKTSGNTNDIQKNTPNVVAERLASKSMTEIVVLAMQLQVECQQLNSQDVCVGVKTILEVLDERLASMPAAQQDTSVAFLKGLMDGVSHANQAIITQLGKTPSR